FISSDSQAVLPANYIYTSTDNGVHTFTVTLKTVGTQSITETDTVNGSITGSQTGIIVNSASPLQLTVSTVGSSTVANSADAGLSSTSSPSVGSQPFVAKAASDIPASVSVLDRVFKEWQTDSVADGQLLQS